MLYRFSAIKKISASNEDYIYASKEMLQPISLVSYTGVIRLSSLYKYWSTDNLYKNFTVPKTMLRKRWQLFLKTWQFSDNANCPQFLLGTVFVNAHIKLNQMAD